MKKFLFVAILITTVWFPESAVAQSVPADPYGQSLPAIVQNGSAFNSQIRGLEVGPFLLDLDVPKGGTIDSEVVLTNRSSAPLVIFVTPRDFLPGVEGQPQFVPDVVINDPTFSLAQWINVKTETQFTIPPEQSRKVPFSLNPPENAEQGTHYGALLFSYVGQNATGNASEIQQSIGTIILVRYGEARENGTVELNPNRRFLWNADKVTFANTFQNTGNVHVQPKGEVYIKNMWGEIIETPFINRDAANILPKTERTFINTWYPSTFAFGRYTTETVLTYGRGRLEARDKVIIWVLPWYLLLALGIIILIILWFIFHGRHWHKRRVIRKHLSNQQQP